MWFYVGNAWFEDDDAKVSVTDHSYLYGDGCFEGIGIFGGRVLHLDEHVERLIDSCRALRIEPPVDTDELRALLLEAAARNGMADAPSGYLRPIISRGTGPLGVSWSDRLGPASLTIIPQLGQRKVTFNGEPETLDAVFTRRRRGDATTVDARVKSNNYLPSIMAYLDARAAGADLAIMCDERGHVTEGHAMNLFCVRGGRLLTPPRVASLEGITRRHVLEVADGLGVVCAEEDVTPYDLVTADEAFVTSSLDGVAALKSIDGAALAAPGPVTTAVRDAYVAFAIDSGTPVPATAGAAQGPAR
jgi:branched-chain amino acid aminotransferase